MRGLVRDYPKGLDPKARSGGGAPSLVSAAGAIVEQVVANPTAIRRLISDDAEYSLVHDDPLLWPYVLANDEATLVLLEGGRSIPFSDLEVMTGPTGAEGATVQSSGFGGGAYPMWHALDVSGTNFFAANTKVNEYGGYVFNRKVEFTSFSYTPASNYPVASQWQITQDGTNWTTVHSFTGGTVAHTHTPSQPL